MKRLIFALSFCILLISILYSHRSTSLSLVLTQLLHINATHQATPATTSQITTTADTTVTHKATPDSDTQKTPQQTYMLKKAASDMAKTVLHHAKITPHRSGARGHADHGWLNTYHSFSFAGWHDARLNGFGALRVLNEDRVRPNSGFPTHPHRDYEIFSYVLTGELTHRDSMLKRGAEGGPSDRFYRVRRGDVQFTTGGTGIAHSEFNEHASEPVHFLQIWAVPWRRGLTPRYHTRHFDDADKRRGFVAILSPLVGGVDASTAQETAAAPALPNTIPIHADLVMGAALIAPGAAAEQFTWDVGAHLADAKVDGVAVATKRKVYVHLPMTKGGKARIRLDGRDDAILEEGDGAFVDGVRAGDKLAVESIGEAEAEVVILDTA